MGNKNIKQQQHITEKETNAVVNKFITPTWMSILPYTSSSSKVFLKSQVLTCLLKIQQDQEQFYRWQ